MKRILMMTLAVGCLATGTALGGAGQGPKKLSPVLQEQRSAVIEKYDSNQDGVLDKNEQKQLSKEDKRLLARTGGVGTAKKASKEKESVVAVEQPAQTEKAPEVKRRPEGVKVEEGTKTEDARVPKVRTNAPSGSTEPTKGTRPTKKSGSDGN